MKIHVFHKLLLSLLVLLIMIVTILFLINKREVAIAESHKKYCLKLKDSLHIPISDFSKYVNRPLVINGIFGFPFEMKLNSGKYSEWSLQIQIIKKATTETGDVINYSAVQSGYTAQLYRFPTDGLRQ